MLDQVENRLLTKGLNTELTLAPSLQIKTQKGRGGRENRTSVYAEAAVGRVL